MDELNLILQKLKDSFELYLPKILLSFIVLLIGYIIARIAMYLVVRVFNYFAKQLRQQFKSINLFNTGAFLGKAIFWIILVGSILIIFDILGFSLLSKWFQGLIYYLPNVIAAVLIIIGAIVFNNILSDLSVSLKNQTGLNLSPALIRGLRFIIIAIASIIALDQLGIEISLLIDVIDIILAAVLFGAALAFGLGASSSIKNILSTYYIKKIYKEGDEIRFGETRGEIIKISENSVVIQNEREQVNIPSKIFNDSETALIKKLDP